MGDRARRLQHLATGGWQRGEPGARADPRRAEVRTCGLHFPGEPVIELLAAAVVRRTRGLRLAFRILRRAVETDMEMIVVAPPRLHLAQPSTVLARIPAQCFFDRGV